MGNLPVNGRFFLTITSRAEDIIYDQKILWGAAADLLNANIIARDLRSLKEQSQVEDVTPDKGDRDKRRSLVSRSYSTVGTWTRFLIT